MTSLIKPNAIEDPTLTTDVFGAPDPIFRKEPGEYLQPIEQAALREKYEKRAKILYKEHLNQTSTISLALREKYKNPIFGKVSMLDVLNKLGECIDPTDTELYCVSQLAHTLQVAVGMEEGGVQDETLILTALIHDLGKITELVGEKPEYVNGPNEPIGVNKPGCGLDNAITTWNHDEFAYQRIQHLVPDHVGWLVRFHSLRFDKAAHLFNDRDRYYYNTYLPVFRKYDLGTKSVFNLPLRTISHYKQLIDKYFPEPLLI